jgi:predicted anti-sigma-YlaC factor YlaD
MNSPDRQSMDSRWHPTDEELEKYSISGGRQAEQVAAIEEHLLVCETCRNRLEEIDQYVRPMWMALQRLRAGTR